MGECILDQRFIEESLVEPYIRVGHRGLPESFPENSLIGILAAIDAGAKAVEFDVQLTRDGVPVVCHDVTLDRTCGENINITHTTFNELLVFSCHESNRLGDIHRPCAISSLQDVCQVLAQKIRHLDYPVDVFIEIKTESIDVFGDDVVLKQVLSASNSLAKERVIISFDYDMVELAKREHVRIGWVLTTYDDRSKMYAEVLEPDFLICNYKKMPTGKSIWHGDWQWFIYDIVDPMLANTWFSRGVKYIESWDVRVLN